MRPQLTTHHRKPRSIGGKSEPRNLSRLAGNKHSAWHLLFQNWTAEAIAEEINRLYLDPDYEFIAIRKEEAWSSTESRTATFAGSSSSRMTSRS
jgi:hypothetical protein